jgi:hypothetical protein
VFLKISYFSSRTIYIRGAHLVPGGADLLERPDGDEDGDVIGVGVEIRGPRVLGAKLERDCVADKVGEGAGVDLGAGGGEAADGLTDQPAKEERLRNELAARLGLYGGRKRIGSSADGQSARGSAWLRRMC